MRVCASDWTTLYKLKHIASLDGSSRRGQRRFLFRLRATLQGPSCEDEGHAEDHYKEVSRHRHDQPPPRCELLISTRLRWRCKSP